MDAAQYHNLDSNGGSEVEAIMAGDKLQIALPIPTRDGYRFDGWFFDKDTWQNQLKEDTFLTSPLTEDITVYAKWTKVYKITFNSNGGSVVEPIYTDGMSEVTLSEPQKTGWVFAGWYLDEGTWQHPFTSTTMVDNSIAEDITLYAKWIQYTISFDSNGGTAVDAIKTDGKSTVELPAAPQREGYEFDGWYFDKYEWQNKFESDTLITCPINADITLYAKWIKYRTVTFNTNGGNVIEPIKRLPGSSIDVDDPYRSGHIFEGWYADEDFDEPISIVPDYDITVYALWSYTGLTFEPSQYGGYAVTGGLTEGDLWIPAYYEGQPVKEIKEYAFQQTSITRVVMPDTIAVIGLGAFKGCSSLTSVRVSKKVTQMHSLAFGDCYNLKELTLPDQLLVLYTYQFDNCTSLEKIIIPISVSSVWDKVFRGCTNITVFCEASEKPSYWDDDWLGVECPVVWGYRAFTISFDSKGGSYISPLSADNKTETTLPTPEKEGFVFEGWYLDEGYEQPFDPATLIDNTTLPKALKLYAKWSKAF